MGVFNVSKKTINNVRSKASKRVNAKLRRKTGKTKVFRSVQRKTARKSARFYFRSRKPSTIDFTPTIRSAVLSLDASRGKLREITDGREVIPYIQKIRNRIGRKTTLREAISVVLKIKMASGKVKHRTVSTSSNHPTVARKNNERITLAINEFLKEGASQTKTAESIYLTTVTVKRFYNKNGK